MLDNSAQRIFVNIASYRDSELVWTVKDLFEKSRHPERLIAGICLQWATKEEADLTPAKAWLSQCRIVEFKAQEALGVCWARHQVQKLWQGEEYTFQIDSHMRFKRNWDDILFEMLEKCDSANPILSSYPISYIPPDTFSPDALPRMHMKFFDKAGIPALGSTADKVEDAPDIPSPSAFCAAGMVFASSKIIEDVPYDPHLYFAGEEIILSVRLWTHGWDIFTPNSVVAYHDYTFREGRRRHWDDMAGWGKLNDVSVARVLYLLGMAEGGHQDSLKDIDLYGLGKVRTLEHYMSFSGIDFKRRLIHGKPGETSDFPADHKERKDGRKSLFTALNKSNAWGGG